jgi:hypothetical protein
VGAMDGFEVAVLMVVTVVPVQEEVPEQPCTISYSVHDVPSGIVYVN